METRTELARMTETVGTHHIDESATAVEMWQDWARGVCDAFPGTNRDLGVWAHYADGKTYSEIELATRVGRRDITRIIEKVEALSAPAPCPNPWRKSGRVAPRAEGLGDMAAHADPRVTARLLSLAVSAADPETLARLVAGDTTLNSMTGGAIVAEAVKRAVGEVRYSRIRMRRNETLKSPMGTGKDLDVLLPKEFGGELVGRPHAGGIDLQAKVTTPGKDGADPTVAVKTLTVPWWKIDHAEKANEEA